MSAVAAAAPRVNGQAELADMIFGMIAEAARKGECSPGYAGFIAAARKRGLPLKTNTIRSAIEQLQRTGRIASIGRTGHRGYSLPGTAYQTRPVHGGPGSRLPVDRGVMPGPTLEERAAIFAGERYQDVPHQQGRVVHINGYLEPHGWASPLVDA